MSTDFFRSYVHRLAVLRWVVGNVFRGRLRIGGDHTTGSSGSPSFLVARHCGGEKQPAAPCLVMRLGRGGGGQRCVAFSGGLTHTLPPGARWKTRAQWGWAGGGPGGETKKCRRRRRRHSGNGAATANPFGGPPVCSSGVRAGMHRAPPQRGGGGGWEAPAVKVPAGVTRPPSASATVMLPTPRSLWRSPGSASWPACSSGRIRLPLTSAVVDLCTCRHTCTTRAEPHLC